MDGWWSVRYGDALAWVEAPSQAAAGAAFARPSFLGRLDR